MIDPTTPSTATAAEALQREGLPYWIVWLMLCVILLLVAFIFLRDKDLRQRLSLSLYGPRRRWNRLTLRARLARERRKRVGLLRELGRTARRHKLRPKNAGEVWTKLGEVEAKLAPARAGLRKASARMAFLQRGGSKRRKPSAADQAVNAAKNDLRRVMTDIASLERHQDALLEDLGKLVREVMPDQEAFLSLRAQIDLVDESIADLQTAIDHLSKT